jgi:hypothetical protein
MIPEWAKMILKNEQADADRIYEDKLKVYYQACKDWVESNLRNRDAGMSITPVPTIPMKYMFSWDEATRSIVAFGSIDPNVTIPTLPPPEVGKPVTPFFTNAGSQSDDIGRILALVTKIASVMGIKE